MPSPPAEEIAAVNAPPLVPAIGAPTTGTVNPNRSVSHVRIPGTPLEMNGRAGQFL
jgi:hypothetical protein